MMKRPADFGKIALIAGTAIAVSALYGSFRQFLIGPFSPTSRLVGSIIVSLSLLAFNLAMPVLLVLLYRTGVRPALSRNLRFAAAALVVIQGAHVLADVWNMWHAVILAAANHAASPAGGQSWFLLSPDSHWWTTTLVFGRAVDIGSALAFFFFLAALACQRGASQSVGKRAWRQVRNAALIATFVGALSIIIELISLRAYAYAVRTYGPPGAAAPSLLYMVRSLLFLMPRLIAPLIILVGVDRSPRIPAADNSTLQPGGAPADAGIL